jgi:hypothetical protein
MATPRYIPGTERSLLLTLATQSLATQPLATQSLATRPLATQRLATQPYLQRFPEPTEQTKKYSIANRELIKGIFVLVCI